MSSLHVLQGQKPPTGVTGSPLIQVHIYAAPLLRMGVEELLDDTRFAVIDASFESASEFSLQGETSPDLFILDVKYSRDGTFEFIANLKSRHPEARVIVLADQFDFNAVLASRQAGADGFCLTSSSPGVLINSIELVMLGEAVVPSEMIQLITREGAHNLAWPSGSFEKPACNSPCRPLSSRELEVLHWLKEGAPNKIIARRLNMAEATVKVHVKKILKKIGVSNRAQAAIWAANNLASPETDKAPSPEAGQA
ncbi:LuxR C-terminal-related transcriptional regulator [Microvirga solisilvae]|uniref:LuxR C-terminal-related transcriptional regulator n=1 Tax=Microvirga solisilvae TaxID=2919498 RepID=UPI001FAFFD26|nr:response regulator transcription factor [Microvirga solisilvae]